MTTAGTLWIISAPSGGGKTSLVNHLIEKLPNLTVSISHTTRIPRQGEVEGKNYFFVDEPLFEGMVQQGLFLEHAHVFKYRYGTSKQWVLDQLNAGKDVILEIDWQGARDVRQQMPSQSIFILPPSRAVLKTRLEGRQQDSPEIIKHRMDQASEEISHFAEYDFVVVNDDFATAFNEIAAIIIAQRLKLPAQRTRHQALITSLINREGTP